MSWLKKIKYLNSIALMVAIMWCGASFNPIQANGEKNTRNLGGAGTTIPGVGVGAIPDDTGVGCGAPGGTPLDITFNSAVSGTLSNVQLDMTATHTWAGDVTATLIAPNGTQHTVFGFTGSTTATGCGADDDLAGLYSFNDAAVGNWWTEATTASPIAPGSYRTSTLGGAVGGGAVTSMNPAFAGVNPTGTWILRVVDNGNGDTGSVTAANLTLTTSAPPNANADYNGDGRTDYTVGRDVGGQIQWLTSLNGSGTTSGIGWGASATDFLIAEDFDGDGRDDVAVWRPAGTGQPTGNAFFYILQSSTNTFQAVDFGQTGDNPAVVGDYDGDGKADPATYRCPALGAGDGQCFYYYKGSLANPSGNITFVSWGFGEDGDFFPYNGDFDGDGKHDVCIQRSNPASAANGQFILRRSSDSVVEYVNWGNSSDFLIPGDYDGDARTDFCVRRTVGGQRHHFILERDGGGTGANPIIWGITGDQSAPGDYDGDGKQDVAVFRPNANAAQNFFYVLRSSDGGLTSFEWGQQNDFAVSGWYVQ